MKKSTNGTLVKTKTKHANEAKAEASIRCSSRLTNCEVNSKEEKTNAGNSNQRTSLTSITSPTLLASGLFHSLVINNFYQIASFPICLMIHCFSSSLLLSSEFESLIHRKKILKSLRTYEKKERLFHVNFLQF